jgi:DAACS family dicarboxylate/amino acid:cation (Na+ or H+) symporter
VRLPLHTRVLIGALLGAAAGALAFVFFRGTPGLDVFTRYVAQPVGQVFLRLLFMLVVPLLFSALALGVAGVGNVRALGRLGIRTLVYTVCVSVIAVLLGITLVNVLKPGHGLDPELRARLLEESAGRVGSIEAAKPATTGIGLLVQIIPDNPLKAAANGDMLGWMFFSLMIGVGLCVTRTVMAEKLQEAIEGLYDVCMRLIGIVIRFSPFGVAALLFTLTSQLGYQILSQLGRYVLVVLIGLAVHQFVVYSLLLATLGRTSPLRFFRGVQEAIVTAFSTASSNATLPTSLKVAEENLNLPRHVSRFVLTIGSTANQNGTALFEGVTVLFLAQFYDIPLTLAQQVMVVSICILGGIGTAGVPAGSIPVVAMILGIVGVPVEGLGLILGVDRFLDMCRTTLNVTGDLVAAVVVARGESAPPTAST